MLGRIFAFVLMFVVPWGVEEDDEDEELEFEEDDEEDEEENEEDDVYEELEFGEDDEEYEEENEENEEDVEENEEENEENEEDEEQEEVDIEKVRRAIKSFNAFLLREMGIEDEMKEETFEDFPNLPNEVQMLIIGEMKLTDRFHFSTCSRISNINAKELRTPVDDLQLHFHEDHVSINIRHSTSLDPDDNHTMTFVTQSPNKSLQKINSRGEQVLLRGIPDEVDVEDYAIGYFKHLLQLFQNNLKVLEIFFHDEPTRWNSVDLGIVSLNVLEDLRLENYSLAQDLVLKASNGLRALTVSGCELGGDFEQIYQVRHNLTAFDMKLNYEQFLQIPASQIAIHIGALTEHNIFTIIDSWNQGTFGKQVDSYQWSLNESDFNISTLCELFGINYDGALEIAYEFKGVEGNAFLIYSWDPEYRHLTFQPITGDPKQEFCINPKRSFQRTRFFAPLQVLLGKICGPEVYAFFTRTLHNISYDVII